MLSQYLHALLSDVLQITQGQAALEVLEIHCSLHLSLPANLSKDKIVKHRGKIIWEKCSLHRNR